MDMYFIKRKVKYSMDTANEELSRVNHTTKG
jgi:hypothetical protein